MTTGSCLCGAVRYEMLSPYRWMTHCHCSMCRKHHGSLFSTSLGVTRERFRWLQGAQEIMHYRSSAELERPFCRHCGSPVPFPADDLYICPAGNLDEHPGIQPRAHVFVGSKSPLHEIADELRQFEEYPPGYRAAVPGPVPPAFKQDMLQGSCLCGEVAFEIDELPQRMTNCHCSRCRRSRGAAYATNVFAAADRLRWIRGAERIKTYRVPDARMFTTAFCERCGSRLPSLFEKIGRYNVPVGGLDTVPSIRPGVHIYVGSKAPWLDITDRLPRFEAMPPRERLGEFFY